MYWRLKDQSEENFLKFRQLGPKVIAQQAEALEGATEVSLLSLAVFEIVDAAGDVNLETAAGQHGLKAREKWHI